MEFISWISIYVYSLFTVRIHLTSIRFNSYMTPLILFFSSIFIIGQGGLFCNQLLYIHYAKYDLYLLESILRKMAI